MHRGGRECISVIRITACLHHEICRCHSNRMSRSYRKGMCESVRISKERKRCLVNEANVSYWLLITKETSDVLIQTLNETHMTYSSHVKAIVCFAVTQFTNCMVKSPLREAVRRIKGYYSSFMEPRKFITLSLRPQHWFPSWDKWIQSVLSYSTYLETILVVYFHQPLGLPNALFKVFSIFCAVLIPHLSSFMWP